MGFHYAQQQENSRMHKEAIVLSSVNAMDPITNMKPVNVTRTIEKRTSGENPLNKN